MVGNPLVTDARVLLFKNDSLVQDYDIAANPITLAVDTGAITPALLNDTSLFSGGVVSFLPTGVVYSGPTGTVNITASTDSIVSAPFPVSFSGYDILSARLTNGYEITEVFADLPTEVRVLVRNGGNLTALANPSVRTFFRSGGGSAQDFFTPSSGGQVDSLTIVLPTAGAPSGTDTLVFELTAEYMVGDSQYTTMDRLEVPVTINPAASFSVVPGSFQPDSVYARSPFGIEFRILAQDFVGSVDSARTVVTLADVGGGPDLDTIFANKPAFDELLGDTIVYRGLSGLIDSLSPLTPDLYRVYLDYRLYSAGNVFRISRLSVDSLELLAAAPLGYAAGTLSPVEVYGGRGASFGFDLELAGTSGLEIEPPSTTIRLTGESFSASTSLTGLNGGISPGTIAVGTEMIVVPSEQVGKSLTAQASFDYRLPGADNFAHFSTDFGGQTIAVAQIPSVKVVELSVVAPNRPKVNFAQPFQLRYRVANLSPDDAVDSLVLRLTSDGLSTFDSLLTTESLPPQDTITAFFDVTAANVANEGETFTVEIASNNVDIAPPLDNTASATIEAPALITLSANSVGIVNGIVEFGQTFSLTVSLLKSGQAAISSGQYELLTGGVDLNLQQPSTGSIDDLNPLTFNFTAPMTNVSTNITFRLTSFPLDRNTGMPAEVVDSVVVVPVTIASVDAELLVTGTATTSGPAVPGEPTRLLSLNLTNTGLSPIAQIQVDRIRMETTDRMGNPVDAGSVVEVGNTAYYDGDEVVAEPTSGGSRLTFFFDEFRVEAGETREIVLWAVVKGASHQSFRINLADTSVSAAFTQGPNAGLAASVVAPGDTALNLSSTVSSVDAGFESSFVIETNPYNPDMGDVRFAYVLPSAEDVKFRIFTLTGEEVLSRDFASGSSGAEAGLNEVVWDGRNDDGQVVFNGVYIAVVHRVDSDESARLKVAVLK